MTGGRGSSTSLALRARTVQLAADWVWNIRIAELTGFSELTVRRWHTRYEESGLEVLSDAPRLGKPRRIDDVAIIADTLANDGAPPAELGISHCSARIMAARHHVSFASVARIWRR